MARRSFSSRGRTRLTMATGAGWQASPKIRRKTSWPHVGLAAGDHDLAHRGRTRAAQPLEQPVGTGVETTLTRWGDYNNMTVDPTDDCTFWFTAELYASNGSTTWDTRIASVKFPACAANDFSIAVSPPSQSISPGGHVAHTVTTGLSATLTLSASPAAAATGTPGPTFTVIGTALSSLHQGAAQIVVRPCVVNGDCDDANLCTTDTCDPVNGCVYAFNTAI